MDIGISQEDRARIVEGLSRVLADTYTLYLKTHNFHWNVVGPKFRTLHLMFEEQYNEMWIALDALAERIREHIDTTVMLPAAGQGALGLEIRSSHAELTEALATLGG